MNHEISYLNIPHSVLEAKAIKFAGTTLNEAKQFALSKGFTGEPIAANCKLGMSIIYYPSAELTQYVKEQLEHKAQAKKAESRKPLDAIQRTRMTVSRLLSKKQKNSYFDRY